MKTVSLNGVVTGEGEGLVLLHPVGLDQSFWGALPVMLARGRRILRLDLRGHGRSDAGSGRAPIEAYAADVSEAIRHYGMDKPTVLGLSFGGMVAQTLALNHPESISRLIACGCPGGLPEAAQPVLRERGLAAEREGMASIVQTTIERWFNSSFLESPIVERVRERLRTDTVQSWSDGWHAISNFNALPKLGGLNLPTLIISGEKDVATPPAASQALAAAIPNAQLVTLPGAPHMMQLETSGLFIEAVGQFLAGNRVGAA